jgi:hypothetical protein
MNGLVLIFLGFMSFADGGIYLPVVLLLVGAFRLLVQR